MSASATMDAMMSGQMGQPAAWMMDHTFVLLRKAKGAGNVACGPPFGNRAFYSASLAMEAVTAAPASTIIQNTKTHSMKIGTAASAP